MDEVGIYRLSGATSEVRRLKDAFDNSKYIMEVNVPVPVLQVPLAQGPSQIFSISLDPLLQPAPHSMSSSPPLFVLSPPFFAML